MQSHDIIKAVTTEPGIKATAARMGISASMLYKWSEPAKGASSSGTVNPLDRILDLIKATGNPLPVQWLAQKASGTFIPNPPAGEMMQCDVIRNTQMILKEFSDLLDVVSRSLQDDGRIDGEEAQRIRREWEHLKQTCESFVCHCEASADQIASEDKA